jgi:hypothetical protein
MPEWRRPDFLVHLGRTTRDWFICWLEKIAMNTGKEVSFHLHCTSFFVS